MSSNNFNAREYNLSNDDFLISRTDLSGRITYANPAFIEVSGFSWGELRGADHNIVRHPQMPRAAFQNLWDTIKAGRAWNGVVKNRRKNGEYYWVQAHVIPYYEGGNLVGYASVRTKVDAQQAALAERVYADINAGRNPGYTLIDGELRRQGLAGMLARINLASLRLRSHVNAMIAIGMLIASYLLGSGAGVFPTELALMILATFALILALLGYGTARSIARPIEEAMHFNSQIAAGNLSARLPDFGRSELGSLAQLMDIMRKSLTSIASDVNRGIDNVSQASGNIAGSNDALAARTEDQAASLQQTAASMEQITSTVEQNASNARHANQLSEQASASVRESGEVMHQLVNKMEVIAESSQKMSEIIGLIDAIAFQTNILALNASIEAARAGDHGRGFAVVATEVRHLAGRSAAAAKEIHELIANSTTEIADGVTLVNTAEQSIDEVINSVTKVSDIMAEISAASAEQSSGIAQIGQAIVQLDTVTQKNSGMVQHAKHVSRNLNDQVQDLAQAITIFQTGQRDLPPAPAAHTERPAPAVVQASELQRARPRQAEKVEEWETF
ncbi:PAS domain-containing protein [Pseudomonas sp. MAP12]|uniref:PAS domain-containing protein n=1 Tax=Geopseudomonas aromaticivorans TaxID=2849492 RepID=A0ABS6MU11_9GAMM|nr:PAS domain-containing methyl-accepting chemotaxis protein [Pseudomonas aromaticivorans]MBV2132297.1 PAS domain-containing protein [Pseudomonas aromaticivorans]